MLTYKQRKRTRKLRNYPTYEENKLWYIYLRKYPLKIRRQHPIGKYIVDFFCKETKLVIEIDGIQHLLDKNIKYDDKRTLYFEKLGYRVVRFGNPDVNKKFDDVCYYIDLIMKERLDELLFSRNSLA
jgi:very-short-patch-repair endonuclease